MPDKLERIYPDPGFWSKTSLIQLCYGIMANLTMVSVGQAYGFSAILIPQLPVVEPKISTTMAEESWIVSVLSLATPFGCVVCGYLMDAYGRSKVLILCEVPLFIGWAFTGFAKSARDLIIGRVIVGFGIGMAMSTPRAYVTEISLPNMRGVVGSISNIAISTGIFLQAALGSFMSWHVLSLINSSFCFVLFFVSFFFPETPYYVLMKDTPEKARAVLRRFRSANYNIEAEMEQLIEFKADNDIHKLSFKDQLKYLLRRSAYIPFFIVTVYIVFAQLSGISIVALWTIDVLEESKSSIDPNIGNILMGVTRIGSGILTSILILKMGRRALGLWSSLGVCVMCLVLGIFILNAKESSILPQLCYIGFNIFASIGYNPLPLIIIFELCPLQIRGILGSLSVAMTSISIFGVNKCFLYVQNAIGFGNTVLGFSIFSFLGSIFIYFFVPETKDLTLQEIEEFYNERRSTLTSQRRIMSMQAVSRPAGNTQSRSLMKIN